MDDYSSEKMSLVEKQAAEHYVTRAELEYRYAIHRADDHYRGEVCYTCKSAWPCLDYRLITRIIYLEASLELATEEVSYTHDAVEAMLRALDEVSPNFLDFYTEERKRNEQ